MLAVTLPQVPVSPEVTEAEVPLEVRVNSEFDLERAPEAFAAFGAGTVGKSAITVT